MKKKNCNWIKWLLVEWVIPLMIMGLVIWVVVMISRMI